ncbi:MAG: hypothetical protein ACPGU6_04340 [Tenacibaculum sp.]
MKKIILLLTTTLFINCSSDEENLISQASFVGKWVKKTIVNEEMKNSCVKTSIIKITEDGNYSASTYYEIKDANNNTITINCNGSKESESTGSWSKNSDSNNCTLITFNQKNKKTFSFKNNLITELNTNNQWKKIE